MRRRLTALFGVAVCAGAGAVAVRAAHDVTPPAAHIPAIPVAKETADARCPIPTRFRSAFERASSETNLPLALLTAVAQVESRFQPAATSSVGAQGLLQVMPTTAAEYAARLYDALHRLDALALDQIVVAPLPPGEEWLAIRDRLRRAAVKG